MTSVRTKGEVPVEVVADLSPRTSSSLPWLLLPLYANLLTFEDVSFKIQVAPKIDGTILPTAIMERQIRVVSLD